MGDRPLEPLIHRLLHVVGRDGGRLNDAAEMGRLTGHQTRINALAFTPDGNSLVSASDDGTILIWDVPRRER
jgi:WD40 repeat protein